MSATAIAILTTSTLFVGIIFGAVLMYGFLNTECTDPRCEVCR